MLRIRFSLGVKTIVRIQIKSSLPTQWMRYETFLEEFGCLITLDLYISKLLLMFGGIQIRQLALTLIAVQGNRRVFSVQSANNLSDRLSLLLLSNCCNKWIPLC